MAEASSVTVPRQECPLGLGDVLLWGWLLSPEGLQSPSAEDQTPQPAFPEPRSQPSSLPPQPPRSPLASHPGRAVGSRGAAGPLSPALQEAALCPEGTGGTGGGPWWGRVFGCWLTASFSPEPGAVLPR